MLTATWLDLVVGTDFHLVTGPMMPPTPMPLPYLGIFGDPAGMVKAAIMEVGMNLARTGKVSLPTGPVLVNGLPAVNTDDIAKNKLTLPHQLLVLPPLALVVPPTGEAKLPLGSLIVSHLGSAAVRAAELALSCSDPAPLPLSKVVTIPKGPPVMSFGPPGINVQAAASKWAFGKLTKATWQVASRAARSIAKLSGPRLRNLVSKARCMFTGDPVDVATGRVMTDAIDFQLPGPIPLVFERNYSSAWADRTGPLGPGWSHSLDQAVWLESESIVYRNAEGQEIVFDLVETNGDLEVGREYFDRISRTWVTAVGRNAWRVVNADGLVLHFELLPNERDERTGYARLSRLTTRADDHEIRCQYQDGSLAGICDSAGRVLVFESDAQGRLCRVLLPHATEDGLVPQITYGYDEAGNLITAKDALGHQARYGYDGGLMVARTDRNRVSFYWAYDGHGSTARCIRTWGVSADPKADDAPAVGVLANPRTLYNQKLDHNVAGGTTLVTNSYNHKTLYKTNGLGLVTEVVDALGGKTVYSFDDWLRPKSVTDPAGRATELDYGPRGEVRVVVQPDGSRVASRYHAEWAELETLFTDECGASWRSEYDSHGRLVAQSAPHPDANLTLEWERGLVKRYAEGAGSAFEILERDHWLNPTALKTPDGRTLHRAWDRRGRLVAETTDYGETRRFAHDAMDRLIAIHEPDGSFVRWSHDLEGNVLSVTTDSSELSFEYTGLNWLAARRERARPGTSHGGDAQGAEGIVRFFWGADGELRAITNEAHQRHELAYDPCLRLERETGFSQLVTKYKRDKAGHVTAIKHPKLNDETILERDALARVTKVVYSDGTSAEYRYRQDGHLLEATNQHAKVLFDRDPLGRITRETSGQSVVESAWASGERHAVTAKRGRAEAAGGPEAETVFSASIERDVRGLPRAISVGGGAPTTMRQEFDVAGFEVQRHLPGGISVGSTRDTLGRITHQMSEDRFGGWVRSNDWGNDGRLAARQDSRFGSTAYEYDGRGRLYAEHHQGRSVYRAPDAVGQLFETPTRADRRYVAGGALRNDAQSSYVFDQHGRLRTKKLADGTRCDFRWDAAGQLVEIRPEGRLATSFTYDALGRRRTKQTEGRVTTFTWDGDALLEERITEVAGVERAVRWLFDDTSFVPVARVQDEQVWFFVTDEVGAPTAAYRQDGELVWQMELDTYGRPHVAQSPTDFARCSPSATERAACPFRWPGQYEDVETGLYYNRHRYYDPALGFYLSPDPLGIDGGLLSYGYVDNPLAGIDPLGLVYVPVGRAPDNLLLNHKTNTNANNNLTEWRRTIPSGAVPAERAKFLGESHVKVAPGTWRSIDGKRQFRTVASDYFGQHTIGSPPVANKPHVHFEFLAPPNQGGTKMRVIKNVHVPLDKGGCQKK